VVEKGIVEIALIKASQKKKKKKPRFELGRVLGRSNAPTSRLEYFGHNFLKKKSFDEPKSGAVLQDSKRRVCHSCFGFN
jgi:hypothetical protein